MEKDFEDNIEKNTNNNVETGRNITKNETVMSFGNQNIVNERSKKKT
jgi:hypothetical protein